MLTLSKTELVAIVKQFYEKDLQTVLLKSYLFNKNITVFSNNLKKQITEASEENFEQWDDYMQWKASEKVAHDYLQKIIYLNYGLFEIA
jgi:hypothetical protein